MSQRLLQGLRPTQVTWCYLTAVEGQHRRVGSEGLAQAGGRGPRLDQAHPWEWEDRTLECSPLCRVIGVRERRAEHRSWDWRGG